MIHVMRNADSPYLADLFVISLRWLVLFGLTISLGTSGALAFGAEKKALPLTIIVLTLPALWNGFVSALAIYNHRLPWHRLINVSLDVIFCLAIFITAGGLSSSVFWVALLPLFSAAIYYEARCAMLVAVLVSLAQIGYTYLESAPNLQILPNGIIAGFNLIMGAVTAVLSAPLIHRLRSSYQNTVSQRKESERKVQRMERDRMRALFSMIETFSGTLNYQTVLKTVLDTAMGALGERNGPVNEMVCAVLLFGDNQCLELLESRGFVPHDNTVALPAEQGALYETLKRAEAHLVENPGQDVELSKLLTLQEQKVALCFPLIRGMNAFGVILFAHTKPDFFTQERVDTLQMLCNQAVIALQNARLYQDLAHEKERIVQSQEEAQKKLARDLHDGPTQSVSAIAMRLNIARKILANALQKNGLDPSEFAETNEELVRVEDLARRTTQEIRHMLFTLRPLVLESEGLEAALKTMADKVRDLYQQKVIIEVEPGMDQILDATRQTVIFYLSEEAINNARKHAQAAEIWVRVRFPTNENNVVLLEIIDNGVGFDVQSVLGSYERRGSLGMVNLQDRTDQVNGLLQIDSVPGKGTRIRVFIPLNEEAADRLHQRR